jgi:hypothetical protein
MVAIHRRPPGGRLLADVLLEENEPYPWLDVWGFASHSRHSSRVLQRRVLSSGVICLE